ncbi:Putative threonine aldolase family protein [Zea mays]|uniref:Putative threonine aldolase family protein n=1 Tax=Zea mays TaxID=4577 RepID=A0A1D6NY34_MAIZE|nr:Putative threonine aldolase family protein [Zea mays]
MSRHEGRLKGQGGLGLSTDILDQELLHKAHFFILQSAKDVTKYIDKHKKRLRKKNPEMVDDNIVDLNEKSVAGTFTPLDNMDILATAIGSNHPGRTTGVSAYVGLGMGLAQGDGPLKKKRRTTKEYVKRIVDEYEAKFEKLTALCQRGDEMQVVGADSTGGKCLSVECTDKVGEIAKSHGLKLHIDGARIFNASVALGVPVDRLVKAADSVSVCFGLLVCLSKGLGAPVGSVIVGSKAFIDKARILRKTLGGGMRQVGVLCAAAHVVVRDTVGKLADDHRKAKALAGFLVCLVGFIFLEGLKKIEQITVDLASVETNMVSLLYHLIDPRTFPLLTVIRFGQKGIPYLNTNDGRTIRYPDPLIKANDTIKIDLETNKIMDFIKFDVGNMVMVTGGRNIGCVGVIKNREKHKGSFETIHVMLGAFCYV